MFRPISPEQKVVENSDFMEIYSLVHVTDVLIFEQYGHRSRSQRPDEISNVMLILQGIV